MRTVEIIGYKRANLGKSESKHLRLDGKVPCVLYGGDEQIHFYAPTIQFRDLVYTPEPAFVKLNIEGQEFEAILQDSQFHPVSETMLHADFLQLTRGKLIKMEIPVKTTGISPGVALGGALTIKKPKLVVQALPKNMPDAITIDVSELKLGKSTKVADLPKGDYTVLNSQLVTIASVAIPRALRGKSEEELEGEEGEGEESAE